MPAIAANPRDMRASFSHSEEDLLFKLFYSESSSFSNSIKTRATIENSLPKRSGDVFAVLIPTTKNP